MALNAEHPTATFDASHDQQCLISSVTSSALSEADFDDVALISAIVTNISNIQPITACLSI
jgi:hypothetical protein